MSIGISIGIQIGSDALGEEDPTPGGAGLLLETEEGFFMLEDDNNLLLED